MSAFIPGVSIETQAVKDWLLTKSVGYVATHKELLELARGKQSAIRSAMRIAEHQHGQVWINVRKTGYQLLSGTEKVAVVESGVRKIHRAAHRVEKRAHTVDYQSLDDQSKRRLDTARTQALFMKTISEKRGAQTISKEIEASPNSLPDVKMLLGAFNRRSS